MGQEIEVKLAVRDLQLLDCILCDELIRARMLEDYRYLQMQTVYYDTEDEFFASRRWMLRLRRENDKSLVTLKTPGDGLARGEWEAESEYLDEALPMLLGAGAPEELKAVDPQTLLPCCGAKFMRIAAMLRMDDESRCELCADMGELTGGGKSAPLCELELELKQGAFDATLAFSELLREKYALSAQKQGKFVRARALKI